MLCISFVNIFCGSSNCFAGEFKEEYLCDLNYIFVVDRCAIVAELQHCVFVLAGLQKPTFPLLVF